MFLLMFFFVDIVTFILVITHKYSFAFTEFLIHEEFDYYILKSSYSLLTLSVSGNKKHLCGFFGENYSIACLLFIMAF